MKTFLSSLIIAALLSVAGQALAQDDQRVVYATEARDCRRFQDNEEFTSGGVAEGDRLQVIFEKDGWLRVRLPGSAAFGWLPADAVTDEAPEVTDEGVGGLLRPGGGTPFNLNLGGGR